MLPPFAVTTRRANSFQGVDQRFSFVRGFIGEESTCLARAGQDADAVDICPADKLRITGARRRFQIEALELGQDQVIDEVFSRCFRKDLFGNIVCEGRGDPGDDDLRGKPRGDGAFAVPDYRGHSVFIDGRNGFVRRSEFCPLGDVFLDAVAVACAHHELLLVPGLQGREFGEYFQGFEPGIFIPRRRSPGGDPIGENAVVARTRRDAAAPGVLEGRGRFDKDQAAPGIAEFHPPPARLAGDGMIIGFRIVSAKTEPEAALTGECAMAGACVTSASR